jgi:L-ascorbate metabolism protein UlaG (beta-lactamase superfamily)
MRNSYYHGPRSDHFDGLRFFNPGVPSTDHPLADLLRWKFGARAVAWPAPAPVEPTTPAAHVPGLRVTVVGHMSVLIQAAGLNILTDPVWSRRAGPFGRLGPTRATMPGIAFDTLPPIDAVLISHNHYDHLDLATLERLHAAHNPLVVTPLGNDTIIRRAVPRMRLATGDWGDRVALTPDAAVTLVPAYHWSARGLRDRRMALWCGFVLHTASGIVYFAGDTAYPEAGVFRRIGAVAGPPDVALIPIGAYEPRWFMAPQHADPEEAVAIMRDVGARRAIGLHWGTFRLTDEPRDEPAWRFVAAGAAAGFDAGACVAGMPGSAYDITPCP